MNTLMKHSFLVVSMLVLVFTSAHAQQSGLSPAEEASLKEAIKEQVNIFNDRLTEIWRRPNEVERLDLPKFDHSKNVYISETLKMFYANGNDWYYYDSVKVRVGDSYQYMLDSVLFRKAAQMQTTSINSTKSNLQTVKTYLNKAKTSKYREVKVTSSDAMFVSDLRKVSDNLYVATLTYTQFFRAYNGEGRLIYGDRTTKTITAYLFPTVVMGEYSWKIALGDIKANETTRL